jgi:hypothetical protein
MSMITEVSMTVLMSVDDRWDWCAMVARGLPCCFCPRAVRRGLLGPSSCRRKGLPKLNQRPEVDRLPSARGRVRNTERLDCGVIDPASDDYLTRSGHYVVRTNAARQ